MNDQQRKSRMSGPAARDAAVQRLAVAARRAREADTPDSNDALQEAVDAARQVGVGWSTIGAALGIASGYAYKRYRKRPTSPDGRTTRHRRAGAEGCELGGPS
jgi:transcriptional/translational regulatory protein YebC/TACO1